jgi:DNA-binding SARP family transcriptional activator
LHFLLQLAHTLIRQRKFQQIYILLKPYVEEYGSDNSLLYYYAASCYKLKKYDEAIEIGERLLNRIEIIKPIYYILIKSYLAKNELNRSSYLLQEAKKVKLDDDKVNKLELLLNKKQSSTLEKL